MELDFLYIRLTNIIIVLFSPKNIAPYIANSSQTALRWAYDEYAAGLFQLAMHILKEDEHAEEMVQDSFVQLWNSRQKLDEHSNIKSLLFVICRNNSFNRLKVNKRLRSRFVKLEDNIIESTWIQLETPFEEKELNELLEMIIQKLPSKQQLVFRLSRLEGLSHQEIAEKLHISKNTVKNHLISALKMVRKELQNSRIQSYVIALLYFYLFT